MQKLPDASFALLKQPHSLVIQEHEGLKCDEIYAVAGAFPNIGLFDVSTCKLDGALLGEFREKHIALWKPLNPIPATQQKK